MGVGVGVEVCVEVCVSVGVLVGVSEGVCVTDGVCVGVGVYDGVGGGNPPLTAAAAPRNETPLNEEKSIAADCLALDKSLKLGGVSI